MTVAARRTKLPETARKDPMVVIPRSRRGRPRSKEKESRHHPRRWDNGEDENGNEGNVDGCPEALLPGALTRRLSACRLRLTLPPSRPPSPPSYPRLASSSGSSPCALWSVALPFSALSTLPLAHLCLGLPVTVTHNRIFVNIRAATSIVIS